MVCLNSSMICDGIIHCNEGEDELNCGNVTHEHEASCTGLWCELADGNETGCLAISSVCDGAPQCKDQRDEILCPDWTEWSAWSNCSVQCESGKSSRTRNCIGKVDDFTESPFTCKGQAIQERVENQII